MLLLAPQVAEILCESAFHSLRRDKCQCFRISATRIYPPVNDCPMNESGRMSQSRFSTGVEGVEIFVCAKIPETVIEWINGRRGVGICSDLGVQDITFPFMIDIHTEGIALFASYERDRTIQVARALADASEFPVFICDPNDFPQCMEYLRLAHLQAGVLNG
jgi:hypothetical protein